MVECLGRDWACSQIFKPIHHFSYYKLWLMILGKTINSFWFSMSCFKVLILKLWELWKLKFSMLKNWNDTRQWGSKTFTQFLRISTSKCMLAHAFTFRKQWKTLKNYFKSTFLSYTQETHVRLTQEHWKNNFFNNFWVFFIVFNHVNACASMGLLVKIHNTQLLVEILFQSFTRFKLSWLKLQLLILSFSLKSYLLLFHISILDIFWYYILGHWHILKVFLY